MPWTSPRIAGQADITTVGITHLNSTLIFGSRVDGSNFTAIIKTGLLDSSVSARFGPKPGILLPRLEAQWRILVKYAASACYAIHVLE